jgi:hypothetical protein
MDQVKLVKLAWKCVFGKAPLCEIEDTNPLTIRVDEFTLIQVEGEVEHKSIKGTKREKVMGWSADVFVSTYSYEHGPDGDTVELGWERNFGDALQLIIAANARQIAEGLLQSETMAEDYSETKRLLTEKVTA